MERGLPSDDRQSPFPNVKILLTGATGFIGSHLLAALRARGHEVQSVSRAEVDMAQAREADWLPHLRGVDAVVNAVGIFRETRSASFRALHAEGPKSLFDACVRAGVRKVVNVSALGADERAQTPYHLSKRDADEYLASLPLEGVVVQPSLVFGEGGTSARMFLTWATMPVLPLPAGGGQQVQPVHIDDAVQAIVVLLEAPDPPRTVPLVGARAVSLRDYLQDLRQSLRLPRARTLAIPAAFMRLAARLGDRLHGLLLDTAAWRMLNRGNTAPADAMHTLLGRPPRGVRAFVDPRHAASVLDSARIAWLLPLMRLSLALVWIVTGIVSMGLYPVEWSIDLLARAGVPAAWRPAMLYGAAVFDLLLGIATLWPWRHRRRVWVVEAGLIFFYTAVITIRLPEFWLHPYGPVLKNLPILAMLLTLWVMEGRKKDPMERR